MAFGIDDIVGQGLKLVNKFVKDPTEKMRHIERIKELQQKGDLAELEAYISVLQGQIDINKIEAASTSFFKSGWRPFVGWVCGVGFAYKFIIQPFLIFALIALAEFKGIDISIVEKLPELNWVEMSTILMGMLGLGTLRTLDKNAGVTHR